MQLTKKDFAEILKSELPKVLSSYGAITKTNLSDALKDYGAVTKTDLKQEILKSERRTAIRLTKVKNDLSNRIVNVAIAKEERSKVEKLEKRLTTLENFQFA